MREIAAGLGSLKHTIHIAQHGECPEAAARELGALSWTGLLEHPPVPAHEFAFEQVPFDHPLWILFTSGTTGLPKLVAPEQRSCRVPATGIPSSLTFAAFRS